ncbi:MAG: hypothetical protein K0S47_3533 [Herbinix sp.]|jgi:acyl-CoA synthetase (NDP forming)|nr:hypothetical protein [Herbinix sp.]
MAKLTKDFFMNNEVIFIGYSSRNASYSNLIYQTFTKNVIKVYPINNKENAQYDVKVYKSLNELKAIPKTAYILMKKENTAKAVKELASKGVKRILFHNNKTVDAATLDECKKAGIETAIACPMMILGGGFHKFHGFLAGVR